MFSLNGFIEEYGGYDGKFFSRNKFIKIGETESAAIIKDFRRKYHNTDVYTSVYTYFDTHVETCKLYGPLYFDLDGDLKSEESFEKIKRDVFSILGFFKSLGLKEEDFEIYFSGSKGFHVIIPAEVLGIEPDERLNLLYKAWAIYLKNTWCVQSIDTGIYDRRRLLRLPCSINSKTGLYKIQLQEGFLRKAGYKDIVARAGNFLYSFCSRNEHNINILGAKNFHRRSERFFNAGKRSEENTMIVLPKEKTELFPCIKNIIHSGVFKGNRNNTAVMLASGLLQSGYSLDEADNMINKWNEHNLPPLPKRELSLTVASAYEMLNEGKRYGCSTFKEYGYCTGESCRLGEV